MTTIPISVVTRLSVPGKYRVKGREVPAGLYFRVTDTGARYWLLRYVTAGKEHWLGLGPHALIGCEGAIERARAARLQLRDGLDPIAQRQSEKARVRAEQVAAAQAAAATVTFREAATAFHRHHAAKWSNSKARRQWLSQLETFVFPTLGELPVGDIDRAAILRTFKPHWTATAKITTAAKCLRRVAAVIDFSVQHGHRTSTDNPAHWRHLQHALAPPSTLAATRPMKAIAYDELPAFYAALQDDDGTVVRAIQFTILTAARTAEVIGARWAELDLDKSLWVLPAARMKARRDHTVPLSNEALTLIDALPREKGNPFLFISSQAGQSLNPTAMISELNRRGAAFTVHGFRSTFRTWASESTTFAPDVTEICLAHLVGSGTERAYNRAQLIELRRRLMQQWAEFVTGNAAALAKVVQLRKSA